MHLSKVAAVLLLLLAAAGYPQASGLWALVLLFLLDRGHCPGRGRVSARLEAACPLYHFPSTAAACPLGAAGASHQRRQLKAFTCPGTCPNQCKPCTCPTGCTCSHSYSTTYNKCSVSCQSCSASCDCRSVKGVCSSPTNTQCEKTWWGGCKCVNVAGR